MLSKIKHRGPDVSTVFSNENMSAAFCETVLTSTQNETVISNEDIVILLDGEIENFNELQEQLKKSGYEFRENSNFELIACLYKEYGRLLPKYIHGAFALLIYDIKENQIFAARDRLGVKPFQYCLFEGGFVFASEVKSILAFPNIKTELNEKALELYLAFQYSVLPETFFKGIHRLMPAQTLIFKDGKLELDTYWEVEFAPNETGFDTAVSDIEKAVVNSIKRYESAETEIGAFLSSGVDSSFIAACFKPKKSFTVGYDDGNYSEIDSAKALSDILGVEHVKRLISSDEYFNILPKAMYFMDEPLADPAAIAFYFGCEEAAKHVKVAFSGEGPDEFFGGYGQYFEPFALNKISFIPRIIRRAVSKILSWLPFSVKGMGYLIRAGKTVEERFIGNAYIFPKHERELILKSYSGADTDSITKPLYDKVRGFDDVTQMQYIDLNLWMAGDILHQADRMSLAHSLNIKTPFLHKKITDLALKLPLKYRVSAAKNKIAFRAAAKNHLPETVAQKKKWGFPVPLRVWLKEEKFYKFTKEHFTSDTAAKFFHTDKLLKLLEQHKKGNDNSRKIWTVLVFIIWYDEFFPQRSEEA